MDLENYPIQLLCKIIIAETDHLLMGFYTVFHLSLFVVDFGLLSVESVGVGIGG